MNEGKTTQKSVILEHLKRFGSIEPLTALREYGCYRLGARIADLRIECPLGTSKWMITSKGRQLTNVLF